MTRWYNAEKKKPKNGIEVTAYPRKPYPLIFWWEKEKAWYYRSPTYCYPVGPYYEKLIKKWAYIKYPKKRIWKRIINQK